MMMMAALALLDQKDRWGTGPRKDCSPGREWCRLLAEGSQTLGDAVTVAAWVG